MKRIVPALFVALALVVAPFSMACAPPDHLATGSGGGTVSATGNLEVTNADMSGTMGNVSNFSNGTTQVEAQYLDANSSWVRIDTDGSGWWAMAALQLNGDIMGPDYAPGTHRQYISGVVEGDPSAPSTDVMGCSGPSHGDWTFDQHTQNVEIWVTGTNALRHLEYQLDFDGQIVNGSFDYRVRSTGI